MKRLLITMLVALTGMIVMACAAPAEAPVETSKETPKAKSTLEPQVVAEWSGSGTKTTQPFTITEAPWAVSWAFNPDPPLYGMYANLFQIYVHKAYDRMYMELPANIFNVSKGTADSSYIYDTGVFYLSISSMSGTWSIKVFEFK